MFANYGSDDRSRWYESRYERGLETIGSKLGPTYIYNKVFVANSIDIAKAIFQENKTLALPEATQVHVGTFVEPKIKKFAAEFYATGSRRTSCWRST